MINSITVAGRLTKDCEVKTNNAGKTAIGFTVVVNERRKSGDKWEDYPNYFDVAWWCNYADKVKGALAKGKLVTVQGALRQDRWEKNGQSFSRIKIVATDVTYEPAAKQTTAEYAQQAFDATPETFTDEIPF